MNPVVHFEMPAEDRKRVGKFYSEVFGWQTKQLGEDHMNYLLATTTPTDDKGMVKDAGRINGGFYQKKNDPKYPMQHPNVVIAVEDLKVHIDKVKAAGGVVLGEPWEIPGVGLYISFLDTERNRVCMLQPYGHC